MPKTIVQKIVFKNIPAAILYQTYTDAGEHSASIGASVKIQKKEGTKFSADDNYITGKTFQLVRDKLVVQSWRASDWSKSDIDSTFILLFEQKGNDGIINMIHANVPDKNFAGIKKGWDDFYWKSWKKYFSQKNFKGKK